MSDGDVAKHRRRLAEETMGANKPKSFRGLMMPRWRAAASAPMLLEYAQRGCPVDVGQDWILEELDAAVARSPHKSALAPDAIDQIQIGKMRSHTKKTIVLDVNVELETGTDVIVLSLQDVKRFGVDLGWIICLDDVFRWDSVD